MGFRLSWPGHVLELEQKTHVMGVLNVTPDSFSDGNRFFEYEKAVEHGLDMARDGADIIDVGGESTRPFSKRISAAEEADRVIPVIQALRKELTIPVSIDTYKAEVARKALKAGASMVNDISALRFDPKMGPLVAEAGVPVVLMHMQGTPRDMQVNPTYRDLIGEVIAFLQESVERAATQGIDEDLLIVDPGIGFGKSFEDNLKLLGLLSRLEALGRPLLIGTSNKAFIGHVLNREPHERETGTMATVAASVMQGAHIVRVHEVKSAVETVRMIDAVKRAALRGDRGPSWSFEVIR